MGVDVAVGAGVGVAVGDTRVGVAIGVAVGGTSLGLEANSVPFVVAVAGALVGLGSGVGDFVGCGFGASFVGVGSTIALTATLASEVGVSTI